MAGTYSQIYIQIVFAVKRRENLIAKSWCEELYRYIAGIITEKNQKSIIVNGYRDHIHCFIGLKPSMSVSDITRDIKNNSSRFINEKKFTKSKFQWQEGYGAFSYSASAVKNVYRYIENQEEHHRDKTFREEYQEYLKEFEVEHDPKYLFEFLE